jgi:hypothetical protein
VCGNKRAFVRSDILVAMDMMMMSIFWDVTILVW